MHASSRIGAKYHWQHQQRQLEMCGAFWLLQGWSLPLHKGLQAQALSGKLCADLVTPQPSR